MYTYDVHFDEVGGVSQKLDVIGHRGLRGSKCSGRPILIFLLKKVGFAP